MIALLVITDGRRQCLEQTIHSAALNLRGPISHRVIYDDSGDAKHRRWLRNAFSDFEVIDAGERQGFGGAIRAAWAHLRDRPERFVFHLEDDFTFNRAVYLKQMAAVLDERPNLVQLALRRQPWNEQERAAGGIVEQRPETYVDMHDGFNDWLEHRNFVTTNPSLYRRELTELDWPTGEHSEGHFGISLFQDPAVRCGFWGARGSGEWVTHIGNQRAGVGY